MKKIFFCIAIAAFFIAVTLSCKKQQNDPEILNDKVPQMDHVVNPIEQQILRFKAQLQNNLKDEEEYKISDAVYNLEALVNYDYADVSNNLMGLDIDSIFITVSLSNGKVTESEAGSVYDKIIDSLTVQYNNLPSVGHLVFADVFSRDSVAGEVTFGIIGAFGYGSPIWYGWFCEDDWWMYGMSYMNNGGYCGESIYAGTHKDDDAAEQIERRIRLDIGVPAQHHIATDITTLEIYPEGYVIVYGDQGYDFYEEFLNPEDETEEDNYYDFLSFVNAYSLPNFHDCLSPDEMNFYWHGEESVSTEIIFDCLEDLLDGKEFMSINIIGDIHLIYPNYKYVHYMTNTYGVWVVNSNDPGTFE